MQPTMATTTSTATVPASSSPPAPRTPPRVSTNPLHDKPAQPPTTTTNLMQEQLSPLERFAMARLQHSVSELAEQVQQKQQQDRSATGRNGSGGAGSGASPPPRKMFHCVVDDTALTASIGELKSVVQEKAVSLLVPLAALDALDHHKKGSTPTAQNARETIRYLDRAQTSTGRNRSLSSQVRIQSPSDRFPSFEAAIASVPRRQGLPELAGQSEPPTSTSSSGDGNVRDILNCTLFYNQQMEKRKQDDRTGRLRDDEVILLTNNEVLALWAREYCIRVEASEDISVLVRREEVEYQERKRQWEYRNRNPNPSSPGKNPSSPPRRRVVHDFTSRASANGRNPVTLQRRHTAGAPSSAAGNAGAWGGEGPYTEQVPKGIMDPNGFGRGGHIKVQDSPGPVVGGSPGRGGPGGRGVLMRGAGIVGREPGRGVARGRGRLWEP